MKHTFQQRVEEAFAAVLAAEPGERQRLIREMCGDDASLRAEVESLLLHHDDSSGLLDRPLIVPPAESGTPHSDNNSAARNGESRDDLPPIRQAGGYRLLSVLGAGGMGVVYLAEQERPRRTVALKLIRPTIASTAVRRRFEHEAELLARLQHPGIAQIFEAALADFGHGPQQFIAMELVRGEPLTAFVRRRQLELRDRLRLMIKVCEAVHHAHQRGVIHRDLKPANILVTDQGHDSTSQRVPGDGSSSAPGTHDSSSPQPKILDFGVARVLDSDIAVTTMQTSAGQLIGTLRYMSPEQVAGDSEAIDARSDVYALGVMLFETLTGRLPHNLDNCSIADAARIIRDQPHTSLSSIHRSYRGDVDTIVSKALEKDPKRRYQSAAELALDLERHLVNQPIIAQPPSRLYTARKFVRRNKAVVTGVVIAFVALAAGLVGTTRAMYEAQEQRDAAYKAQNESDRAQKAEERQRLRAEQQVRVAQAVNLFVNEDLLGQADPMNQPDPDIRLREVLDRSADRIDGRFNDQPEAAAAVHTTIGLAHQNLGLLGQAEEHLRAALDLRRQQVPSDPKETASALNSFGMVLWHLGKYDESEGAYQEAIEIQQAAGAGGMESPGLAGSRLGLALVIQYKGKLQEAEPLMRDAVKAVAAAHGEDHPETAGAKDTLAGLLLDLGQHAEAEALYRAALETRRTKLGEDHYLTLHTTNNLAVLLAAMERYDAAEELHRSALPRWEKLLGADHPAIGATHHNLADIARHRGDNAVAEAEYRAGLAIFRKSLGDDHDNTLSALNCLGEVLLQAGRTDDAEPIVRESMERRLRVSGPDHPNSYIAVMNYGWLLKQRGKLDEAVTYYQQGLDGRRRTLGEDHPATIRAMGQTANLMRDAGHPQEAEPLYREIVERRRRLLGEDERDTLIAMGNLAACLIAQDRLQDALTLQEDVLARRRRTLAPDHADVAASLHECGQSHLKLRQFQQAEQSLQESLAIRRKGLPAGDRLIVQSLAALGESLTELGRFEEAESTLSEALAALQAEANSDQARIRPAIERIIRLYSAWGKPTEAERFQAMLDQTIPASQ